ncbi:MAG: hypothetical protein HKN18_05205 [Silicimonas sp.]|nr:hypothetical protein [Silicimonas sp.]
MADRAMKADGAGESRDIVELDKDERWQARLAEARARREVALREKASKPKKPRRKPWEEEPGQDPDSFTVEPIVQEPDPNRRDFADRFEALRETIKSDKHTPANTKAVPAKPKVEQAEPVEPRPEPAVSTPASNTFDDIIPPDQAPPEPVAVPMPPRKKEVPEKDSLIAADAPDVAEIAQRYAATLAPMPELAVPEVQQEPEPEDVVEEGADAATATTRRKPGRPLILLLLVLTLAAVPLLKTPPPLEIGPSFPATPRFGLPPALGITTSMLWRPGKTFPGDWSPASVAAPARPLTVSTRPPAEYLRTVPGLDAMAEEISTGSVSWSMLSPVIANRTSDRLFSPITGYGASALVPESAPRPRPRSPVLKTESVPNGDSDVQSQAFVDGAINDPGPAALSASAPDAVPSVEGADMPPPITKLSMTILVPVTAKMQRAEQIADDLRNRGHSIARIQKVDVSIRDRNIRYFHNGDRREARRLAKAYDAELKDFTWFQPKPPTGTTEIWLSGKPNRIAQVPVPSPEKALGNVTEIFTPKVVIVRRKPSLWERLFSGTGETPSGNQRQGDGDENELIVNSGSEVVPEPDVDPVESTSGSEPELAGDDDTGDASTDAETEESPGDSENSDAEGASDGDDASDDDETAGN